VDIAYDELHAFSITSVYAHLVGMQTKLNSMYVKKLRTSACNFTRKFTQLIDHVTQKVKIRVMANPLSFIQKC
jgi:4-hydroxyphenylpyruvate dioxygenase-like putative hemolysin